MRSYILLYFLMFLVSVNAAEQEKEQKAEQAQKNTWEDSLESDVEGVTTTDRLRGNWYSKRKILNESRQIFEAIRKKIDQLEDEYDKYLSKRDNIVDTLDTFYADYPLRAEEVDRVMQDIAQQLEKAKAEGNSLTEEEQADVPKLESQYSELEQLQVDMRSLDEFRDALDQSLRTLYEQINKARDFEEKAWEYYNAISQELNDKVANQMYYEMKGLNENVKKIHDYMTRDINTFVSNTSDLISDYIEEIKADIDSIEKQGIVLRENIEEEVEEQPREVEQEAPEKQVESHADQGWFQNIVTRVKMAWHGLVSWVMSWFLGNDSLVKPKESQGMDIEGVDQSDETLASSSTSIVKNDQEATSEQIAGSDVGYTEQAEPNEDEVTTSTAKAQESAM